MNTLWLLLPLLVYSHCNRCTRDTKPTSGMNTLSTGFGTIGQYYYGLHYDTPVVEHARINISFDDLDTGTEPSRSIELYAQSLGTKEDDAGHILAEHLGGCACYTNIFPQSRHINRGAYRLFEEDIYKCINNNTIASIEWTFVYGEIDDSRPSGVFYDVLFDGDTTCKTLSKQFEN